MCVCKQDVLLNEKCHSSKFMRILKNLEKKLKKCLNGFSNLQLLTPKSKTLVWVSQWWFMRFPLAEQKKQDLKGFQSHRMRNYWQNDNLMTAWQLHDDCLISTLWLGMWGLSFGLPENYLRTTWQLPDFWGVFVWL